MPYHKVGKVAEFQDLEPKVVEANGMSIGIVKQGPNYYGFLNRCPHQGGPMAEGAVIGNTECELAPDRSRVREFRSTERYNIACPWHAVEYDLRTGFCKPDARFRMIVVEVAVQGDDVLVKV